MLIVFTLDEDPPIHSTSRPKEDRLTCPQQLYQVLSQDGGQVKPEILAEPSVATSPGE